MKKVILLIAIAVAFVGCAKEEMCDCTYYSADSNNGRDWTVTYESNWDTSCGDEDFGTSKFTYGGQTSYTKTYVRCR